MPDSDLKTFIHDPKSTQTSAFCVTLNSSNHAVYRGVYWFPKAPLASMARWGGLTCDQPVPCNTQSWHQDNGLTQHLCWISGLQLHIPKPVSLPDRSKPMPCNTRSWHQENGPKMHLCWPSRPQLHIQRPASLPDWMWTQPVPCNTQPRHHDNGLKKPPCWPS